MEAAQLVIKLRESYTYLPVEVDDQPQDVATGSPAKMVVMSVYITRSGVRGILGAPDPGGS